MIEVENVVVVTFEESNKAYEALSVLKQLNAQDRISLASAAVVERTPEGELHTPEDVDNVGLVGTASGSLIGMLIGVLAGPLGMLIGFGAGAVMGGAVDMDRAEESDEAVTALAKAISPGSTGVIACVEEPVPEVIDAEMGMLGGQVTRRPAVQVLEELEAADVAADAAAREARHAMHAKRRAELNEDLDERVGKLKEKLHVA